MGVPSAPSRTPRPSHTRRIALIGVMAALCVALAVAVLVLALRIVHTVSPGSPPYEPADASWRYGERLMEMKVYRTLTGNDDITVACRRAISFDRHAPAHLDLDRAVEGCRYGEWVYDN